jgi:hypothetical protein
VLTTTAQRSVPRNRWEDNATVGSVVTKYEFVGCILLTRLKPVDGSCEHGNEQLFGFHEWWVISKTA